MRNIISSGPKSSVCAGVAVALTALIAGIFDLYTPYIRSSTSDTVATGQEIASTSETDRAAVPS
jgi:hypothetical protein